MTAAAPHPSFSAGSPTVRRARPKSAGKPAAADGPRGAAPHRAASPLVPPLLLNNERGTWQGGWIADQGPIGDVTGARGPDSRNPAREQEGQPAPASCSSPYAPNCYLKRFITHLRTALGVLAACSAGQLGNMAEERESTAANAWVDSYLDARAWGLGDGPP